MAHLGAVCVIGRTSASRLGARDVSKPHQYIAVELFQEPASKKSAAVVKPIPPPKPPIAVKPPDNPVTRPPTPNRAPTVRPTAVPKPSGTHPTAANKVPGNPGSLLNGGSMSANGNVPVPRNGSTSSGWVPGTGTGTGQGSGNGSGIGTPDPPKHADDGPGTHPAPAPPAPKMVSVRICEESGLLPGEYCRNTRMKSFVEGEEPTRRCNRCKAPEPPPHINRLADSAVPVLISGPKPRIPDSIEEGLSLKATVEFTVDADGSVSGARISRSSGYADLDRNILSAVSRWKYKPAVQDGVPRRCKTTVPFLLRT